MHPVSIVMGEVWGETSQRKKRAISGHSYHFFSEPWFFREQSAKWCPSCPQYKHKPGNLFDLSSAINLLLPSCMGSGSPGSGLETSVSSESRLWAGHQGDCVLPGVLILSPSRMHHSILLVKVIESNLQEYPGLFIDPWFRVIDHAKRHQLTLIYSTCCLPLQCEIQLNNPLNCGSPV